MVIEPERGFLSINFKEILAARELLFLFIKRDFLSRYRQTLLGPLWFVLQPLLTSFVFAGIFSKVTRIPTDRIPAPLFYFCGLLIWNYFSQCVSSVAKALVTNADLFKKVYFPRLIIPFAAAVSPLVTFLVQLATFLIFYLYLHRFTPTGTDFHPNFFVCWLPFLLLQTLALGLGIGLWISVLTVRYRDLQHLIGALLQLWMYLTPIIYPASVFPAKWRFLTSLNPMSPVIEFYRYAFFGQGFVHPAGLAAGVFVTILILVSGMLVFNKVERTFVDTI